MPLDAFSTSTCNADHQEFKPECARWSSADEVSKVSSRSEEWHLAKRIYRTVICRGLRWVPYVVEVAVAAGIYDAGVGWEMQEKEKSW